ncbi:MAG: DUF2442 domain-containing protein [Actinomycetota bacterium]
MSSSPAELRSALAIGVRLTDEHLVVNLTDGRTLTIPLSWFPRLVEGTSSERSTWRLVGGGQGIHWPDLDEDISVDELLAGLKSGESQESLKRWRSRRKGSPE